MGLKIDFHYDLGDKVKTIEGVEGVITHCGYDTGGQHHLVNWKKEDGSVESRWYRPDDLIRLP